MNKLSIRLLCVMMLVMTGSISISLGADTPVKPRARDLGIPFDGVPGPFNAITDVAGVTVGQQTLISGEGKLIVGKGPVRTGVTAILPRGKSYDPVFAGWYALNGNGEMTGTTWVEESGFLEGPVMITNTHSVGVVRDAVIKWQYENELFDPLPDDPDVFWSLPVVAETYDGDLNDIQSLDGLLRGIQAVERVCPVTSSSAAPERLPGRWSWVAPITLWACWYRQIMDCGIR